MSNNGRRVNDAIGHQLYRRGVGRGASFDAHQGELLEEDAGWGDGSRSTPNHSDNGPRRTKTVRELDPRCCSGGLHHQPGFFTEVQRAGLEALAKAEVPLEDPLVLGHGSLKLRPEWRGLWVLNGGLAEELGIKIDEIGFQQ